MPASDWIRNAPFAVTVCDAEGIIIEMNEKAVEIFAADGGRALIGANVLDCHPEPARSKLADQLGNGGVNCYTIEKNGRKKLIYQAPWFRDGRAAGIVELSLEIPSDLPHFIRR
jgi:PAS domain-containing protein